ncbi:MAG: ubiquitin-like domain-containing protein [Caldilinea sp.]
MASTIGEQPNTVQSRTDDERVGYKFRIELGAGVAVIVLALSVLYALTAKPVYISVDGIQETVYTHRASVDALLLDIGLQPTVHDRITPPAENAIERDMVLVVERALPIRFLADGRDFMAYSWGETPRQVLSDAGILIDTHDEVLVNGQSWGADKPLPRSIVEQQAATYNRGFAWDAVRTEPIQLRVRRAVPLVVHEGAARYTIDTTAQTIGEALRKSDVILYLGDRVQPSLGSAVTANLHVYIQRSVPVSLQVDGRLVKTRTQGETVADALSDLGIVLTGQDRIEPALDTKLYNNLKIAVTRVSEDVVVEEEIAPFETVFVPDPNLPIDTQEMLASGAEGITRTRYRIRYEDAEPVSRVLEDTWLAQEPSDRRIAYGQKIEPRAETMADGTVITYWRKIRMLATSYSAASAGGNRTRTGDIVREGIVAVDPRLIPLRSQVYVPGYGIGDALDTGGGIISRRIDLAYETSSYVSVRRWVDVYLLWPPPSSSSITWVVPNYPPVPR